jgi:hypothetical protein
MIIIKEQNTPRMHRDILRSFRGHPRLASTCERACQPRPAATSTEVAAVARVLGRAPGRRTWAGPSGLFRHLPAGRLCGSRMGARARVELPPEGPGGRSGLFSGGPGLRRGRRLEGAGFWEAMDDSLLLAENYN